MENFLNTILNKLVINILFVTLIGTSHANNKKTDYQIPKLLLEQVDKGNSEAAYFIADTFLNGSEKININHDKAIKWLKKAAKMGNPHAILSYAKELDSDGNHETALTYYQHASENGMPEAYEMIGNYYLEGKAGLKKNCHKAYVFFEKAELREYKTAFNNHAWSLATAKDSECNNPERALRVFYKMLALYGSDYIPLYIMDTKAAVLAAVSDFGQAIKIQQEIIDDMKDKEIKINPQFIKHLESYKLRQAWIE